MYRGKDIENREKFVQTCLQIFESGTEKQLYAVLPHISVVRSPSFVEPLLKLLRTGSLDQKEFAAMALGSLGEPRCIEPLFEVFMQTVKTRPAATQSLQAAIIVALGESGDNGAVEPLLQIYGLHLENDSFGRRRKRLVLGALGALAQQGNAQAERALAVFLDEHNPAIRAQAVSELSVAFWHRPNHLSEDLFGTMVRLAEESSADVRRAAFAALSNLADLGCKAAERYVARQKLRKRRAER